MKTYHYSVLLEECIDGLNIKENGKYIDATVGYAGHATRILQKCKKGYLFAFDEDENAAQFATTKLQKISDNFRVFKENFANMKEVLATINVDKVDGILFDLGFSSPQIDEKSRGFSFMNEGPLDMRMDMAGDTTAKKIIDSYSESKLAEIFFKYGEEKLSKVIAKKVVKEKENINTTLDLVNVIKIATGENYFYKHHPERKIFQALRIEVNHELDVLEKILPIAIDLLNKGGRICVITFHSLEDKIVKKVFNKFSKIDNMVKGLPDIPLKYQPKIKLINHKPITASDKELAENSRSHSAKLRIIERI